MFSSHPKHQYATLSESAHALDVLIPFRTRRFIRNVLSVLLALGVFAIQGNFFTKVQMGTFFVMLSIWVFFWLLEFFHNSFYYASVPVHFEAAAIVHEAHGKDLVSAYMHSVQGRWVLLRLGITKEGMQSFLSERKKLGQSISFTDLQFAFEDEERIDLELLTKRIFEKDPSFLKFFILNGVKKEDVLYAAAWFDRRQTAYAESRRWWSKEALSRIPGLAKDWTFGRVFFLSKYGREVAMRRTSLGNVSFGQNQLMKLESALAKQEEANALLVGERGAGVLDLVYGLAETIASGQTLPQLEHKRVFFVDLSLISAVAKEKTAFEFEYNRLLQEATRAGNIILVFEDINQAIQIAKGVGADFIALTDPYLASSEVQVIAVSDTYSFHSLIEPNHTLMERFEKIIIDDATDSELERFVELKAEWYESRERVHFTAPALRSVVETTRRYFGTDAGLDKVSDLLSEVVPRVRRSKRHFVLTKDILALIEEKTGVPLGTITNVEKDSLLHMEELLHKEVVGQDEAIVAIANAMRRARAGITSQTRPMGSFLFLGPTGVGKTETTKALARLFFKTEESMMRLDMSEFKGEDALKRLIGQFEDGKSGILSSMLRDKQYGVLLLDEFEKASKDVHDLFLQILDEGFFSDMLGRKVYARNLIIIATSNAGSDLIWEVMQNGQSLVAKRADIIDEIVKRALFRPELLNRFDGVILFHPLAPEHLKIIAELMLKKLNKRLTDKGVQLEISSELISYLVEKGNDRQFGARAMNRAIQESVEQIVAKKIIAEEVQPGSVIRIGQGDLMGK